MCRGKLNSNDSQLLTKPARMFFLLGKCANHGSTKLNTIETFTAEDRQNRKLKLHNNPITAL